jgi:cytosine/adenosine deaminase-related metal-dependent hydrolase
LARLLRQGTVRPIAHPDEGAEDLRGLFLHYFDVGRELATFRNKLKATFRQDAIPTKERAIYDAEAHARWLRKLRGRASGRMKVAPPFMTGNRQDHHRPKSRQGRANSTAGSPS